VHHAYFFYGLCIAILGLDRDLLEKHLVSVLNTSMQVLDYPDWIRSSVTISLSDAHHSALGWLERTSSAIPT